MLVLALKWNTEGCAYRFLASEVWSGGLNKDNCFQEEVFSGFQRTELWDLWFPKCLQCLVLNFCLTFFNYYIRSAGAKCKFWISALSKWEFHSFTHWESSVKNLCDAGSACLQPLSEAQYSLASCKVESMRLQWCATSALEQAHEVTLKQSVFGWSLPGSQVSWVQVGQMQNFGKKKKNTQICFKVRFLLKSRCFLLHLLNLLSGG